MQRIITTLAVLLFGSPLFAQVDPGHSILRSAVFSRSSGSADGSGKTSTGQSPSSMATVNYAGASLGGCANGSCGGGTSYIQPDSVGYGGCADGSCGLPPRYATQSSGNADYEIISNSYSTGNCEDGRCGLPLSYVTQNPGDADYETISNNYSTGNCANGRCGVRPSYSQPIYARYGGCADGSCGLPTGDRSSLSDYGTDSRYPGDSAGNCANGNCELPAKYAMPTAGYANQDMITGYDGYSSHCADGSCALRPSDSQAAVYQPRIDSEIWQDSYLGSDNSHVMIEPVGRGYPTTSATAYAPSGGCADGSCLVQPSVNRQDSLIRRVSLGRGQHEVTTVQTPTATNNEYYSSFFPTSYLEDSATTTEYTNHISVIRRAPDVESQVLNASGTTMPEFSALP